jgi:hypothetical protein
MLQPLSQTEKLLRDTLITKSESWVFESLASLFGLPKPSNYSEAGWRKALRAIAYAPRGTLGATHDCLEGAFSESVEKYTVTLNPAHPQRVTFVTHTNPAPSTSAYTNWTCRHIQRLVKIKFLPESLEAQADASDLANYSEDIPWVEKIFWTKSAASFPTTTIELAAVGTSYWNGADWSTGDDKINTWTTAYMEVLAFRYAEPTPAAIYDASGVPTAETAYGFPCEFQIETDAEQFTSPSRYLLDPAGVDKATLTPNPPPYGGHIMDEFNLASATPAPPAAGDPLGIGPHPTYLAAGETTAKEMASIIDDTLAAGVELSITVKSFCEAE